jgi:hypothetical protein
LTAHTARGAILPDDTGYTVAALIGAGLCAITALAGWVLSRDQSVTAPPNDLQIEESVDAAAAGVLVYEPDRER